MGKGTGEGFSICVLIVIWLVFFGGWNKLIKSYEHLTHPRQQQTLPTSPDGTIKQILNKFEKLDKPLPADSIEPGTENN